MHTLNLTGQCTFIDLQGMIINDPSICAYNISGFQKQDISHCQFLTGHLHQRAVTQDAAMRCGQLL